MSGPSDGDASFADVGGVLGIFSGKADDYERARPGYPPALYEHLERCLAAPGPLTIADVGAGTGLLTRGWLARGHRVIAVEPNERMRAVADRAFAGATHYTSSAGCAEATGLDNACIDLVTAAQAFHWFDPPAFRAECLRVLRPQGVVALIWNDRDDDPLNRALTELFTAYGGAKRARLLERNEKTDRITGFFGHGPCAEWVGAYSQQLDRTGLRALVFSRSFMPAAQSEAGNAATRAVDAVFDAHATADRVAVRYVTRAFVGRPA